MTGILLNDVRHLAQLSSLQLGDDEAERLRVDIENILKYVEQLSTLDTSGVEPTYQTTGLENVWRDDVAQTDSVSRETLLSLAPEHADYQVKVPKVL